MADEMPSAQRNISPIELLRLEHTSLTQDELAVRCGIPRSTYQQWIAGKTERGRKGQRLAGGGGGHDGVVLHHVGDLALVSDRIDGGVVHEDVALDAAGGIG